MGLLYIGLYRFKIWFSLSMDSEFMGSREVIWESQIGTVMDRGSSGEGDNLLYVFCEVDMPPTGSRSTPRSS